MMRHVSYIFLLEWSTTSQRLWVCSTSVPYAQTDPRVLIEKRRGQPGNSGLSSQQQIVVHYPRTVLKISYAEHKVTSKKYNKIFDSDIRGNKRDLPDLMTVLISITTNRIRSSPPSSILKPRSLIP